jgi:hypothetical protein
MDGMKLFDHVRPDGRTDGGVDKRKSKTILCWGTVKMNIFKLNNLCFGMPLSNLF